MIIEVIDQGHHDRAVESGALTTHYPADGVVDRGPGAPGPGADHGDEGIGDGEDYAIAEFMSLRAPGFSNDQLRIGVLRDLNLRLAHAILVVDLHGEKYVLDNQTRDVVPAAVIHHYQPIYSVNKTHGWLHHKG